MIEIGIIWLAICCSGFILLGIATFITDTVIARYWPDDPAWPDLPGRDDPYDMEKYNVTR